jgi:hypothetical protein
LKPPAAGRFIEEGEQSLYFADVAGKTAENDDDDEDEDDRIG